MKVFIVGGDVLIERMFAKRDYEIVPEGDLADLIVFTGGSDVDPTMYNHRRHPTSHTDLARDLREAQVFERFRETPKAGICRGGQFLNVMSGGTMWQDVNRHAIGGTHEMIYLMDSHYDYNFDPDEGPNPNKKKAYSLHSVTSTHHQMMRPDKKTSELWGYAHRSNYRDIGGYNKRNTDWHESPDVEIVWYKDYNSLCFQPHPEYGVKDCEDLFFTCLNRAFGF